MLKTSHGDKQSLNQSLKDNPNKQCRALSNEWGRLSEDDTTGVEYINTIKYIHYNEVPSHKKVTYTSFVRDFRPLKDEKWKVRLVIGGNKLSYEFDVGSQITDMVGGCY